MSLTSTINNQEKEKRGEEMVNLYDDVKPFCNKWIPHF